MPPAIPSATYRLQLTRDFGFDDAARIVPYLKALGISHLYASPFLKARAGSTHGYDIVDHNALNPELGGEDGLARLSQALAEADLGLILDFVPNHMGIGRADNAWWLDVLEWGPQSPHARSFDIDWETLPFKPEGGVLLPILGKVYGEALEAGEIALRFDPDEGSFSAWYYAHRLPIRPNRYGDILRNVVAAAGANDDPRGRRLLEIAALYPDPRAPGRAAAPAYKALIAAADAADLIERGLAAYRPAPDDPAPALALHRLLERQHYRLAHWRLAVSEINYRRFFDISDLAGLRVEDLPTFAAMHRLVARLIAEGRLDGLRLDHIDGLANPAQYVRRLTRLIRRTRPRGARPLFLAVEKILAPGEALPAWPGIMGTTGYEWTNALARLFIAPAGLPLLAQAAQRLAPAGAFAEVLAACKRRVLHTMLASEFTVLARLLARIAAGHWRTRDFTFDRLQEALRLYVLQFPVYRTYVGPQGASAADRATIAATIAQARARWFGPDIDIFGFLADALTLDLVAPGRRGYSRVRVERFALKVQQFTGPLMAKALEDTAFYRYLPLVALNEVGGDPTQPPLAPADFHRAQEARAASGTHGLTATATHDTKRGEDARMRLVALSELAADWSEEVEAWRRGHAALIRHVGGLRAPSASLEYLLYQTLIGAWEGMPDAAFVARIEAYAIKAAREAKLETSWMDPHAAYEDAAAGFVRAILDPAGNAGFLAALDRFAARAALIGAANSLAQLALKATMPGVPDFYQGTEFWDLALVDPDNRHPVDFPRRAEALAALGEAPDWPALVQSWRDGRVKLALTRELLALRRRFPRLFAAGDYRPLAVAGADAGHLVAFARREGADVVAVVAGRHFAAVADSGRHWPRPADWDAAVDLSGLGGLHNLLAPGPVPAGPVAAGVLMPHLPVALLWGTLRGGGARRGRA